MDLLGFLCALTNYLLYMDMDVNMNMYTHVCM